MDLKRVEKKIIKENNEKYQKCNYENFDTKLMSEDSIRKRIKNLYNAFLDYDNQLSKFPIQKFKEQDQESLLENLFWKIQEGNNREILSKVNKADENVDLESWYFTKCDELKYLVKIYKKENRNIIKNFTLRTVDCMEYLKENFKKIEDPRMLIELSFDSWIQMMTYRLYSTKGYKTKDVQNISKKLLKVEQSLIKEIEKNIKDKKTLDINIENSFDKLVYYLQMRRVEKNLIDIFKYLIEDINENSDKYKLIKNIYKTYKDQDIPKTNLEIETILCEGIKVNDFSTKLEETKSMINIFNTYGNRKCYTNKIQDLKVYFREIYLDDTKYSKRARKAMSIVRAYLEDLKYSNKNVKEFESLKEYIFLREKISKGYYREIGKISEYILRCKLYETSYELYSTLLLIYDDNEIKKMCYLINKKLFERALTLLRY